MRSNQPRWTGPHTSPSFYSWMRPQWRGDISHQAPKHLDTLPEESWDRMDPAEIPFQVQWWSLTTLLVSSEGLKIWEIKLTRWPENDQQCLKKQPSQITWAKVCSRWVAVVLLLWPDVSRLTKISPTVTDRSMK